MIQSVTYMGIEPATFRVLAQCLNQICQRAAQYLNILVISGADRIVTRVLKKNWKHIWKTLSRFTTQNSLLGITFIPYPTAFPYGNGMVLHFYEQQESSTTKTVHKVINKGLKAYV